MRIHCQSEEFMTGAELEPMLDRMPVELKVLLSGIGLAK